MSELERAEDYRYIAEQKNLDKYLEMLKIVKEKIEEAARNGKFYCIIVLKFNDKHESYIMDEMLIKELIKRNFRVSRYEIAENEYSLVINW